MTSTNATPDQVAARPVPPLLYPTLLIAGILVIIASMLGIAAMTGVLPQSQAVSVEPAAPVSAPGEVRNDGKTVSRKQADLAKTVAHQVNPSKPATPVATTGATRCDACGVVDTIRAVEAKGQGSGVGAVAGGVVGGILGNQVGGGNGRTAMTVVGAGAGAYAGHELEKNMNKNVSYEVRVRMDDNSYRTFHFPHTDVGVGQRVMIRNGQLVRTS